MILHLVLFQINPNYEPSDTDAEFNKLLTSNLEKTTKEKKPKKVSLEKIGS